MAILPELSVHANFFFQGVGGWEVRGIDFFFEVMIRIVLSSNFVCLPGYLCS